MRVPDSEPDGISNGPAGIQRKCAACESGEGLCPKCAEEEEIQRKSLSPSTTPFLWRQTKEPQEEEEFLQAKETSGRAPQVSSEVVQNINTLRGGGQPLPESARSFFEPRFGHDFSRVRVHTDAKAAESAHMVRALAYMVGQDIVFATGQYAPTTGAGRELIAHELAHVVQQGANLRNVPIQRVALPEEGPAAGTAEAPSEETEETHQRMHVCIQPVQIADPRRRKRRFKNPTMLPSFAAVQSIWASCCLDITVEPARTIANADYRTLDVPQGLNPSQEAENLFRDASIGGQCIWVFVPEGFVGFHHPGENIKKVAGGGITYDMGNINPRVLVVEGTDPTVLAHEVGHALGYTEHRPRKTIMQPSGAYNKAVDDDKVSDRICNTVRQFVNATPTENTDCVFDFT